MKATKRRLESASKLALNQRHFEDLARQAKNDVLRTFQRSIGESIVDQVTSRARADFGLADDIRGIIDDLEIRRLRISQYSAIRTMVDRMVEDAVQGWTPEEGMKLDPKPHFNRAAFYAQDQVGAIHGASIRHLSKQTGSIGYEWLRTESANPRDIHLARVGKTYRWGEVTDEPGVLYNCKCGARPIYSAAEM